MDQDSAPCLPLYPAPTHLHPGEPTQSRLPLSPQSWLKTLLHGLRHKSPKWIKLLSLSSFLQWEISKNKSLCRLIFSHGSAQLGHLALNKGDVELNGNCRAGCWTLSSTLPAVLCTKCKRLRRYSCCTWCESGGSFSPFTLAWMYWESRTALASSVYSLILSLELRTDDSHIIPALTTLIWCGFHSFSCKSNHLMDGNVYPPQISTFLPSPPPS